ncbi:LysR family transcriptional regulator [Nocardioides houyundeii]|uniref:LysR family transcriptional regulator n=1 Tax=Nocardioides houyundeii TaxID=2045452 RepID=UPI000C7808B6|nr:LysR family transcriptional regulator [Nocardioides houyundeii]
MRVEQLEYVVAVTRHGSLRRASESVHLSQPALSEAITRLESELGVVLLDRRRSGARISREGLELLPHLEAVLESVARLREAAGDRTQANRVLRLGTVGTATSTLLTPALRDLSAEHPDTRVEVVNTRQDPIDAGLLDGSLDLGLVNVLEGDDPPAGLYDVPLLAGPTVAVLPHDHPLAGRASVDVADLRAEPFVAMREGYLMHRLAVRLFGDTWPRVLTSTDGAELGKAMVADGAGLTVLPAFSVAGDPLERAGVIVQRPVTGLDTTVSLALRMRRTPRIAPHVRHLRDALTTRARAVTGPPG